MRIFVEGLLWKITSFVHVDYSSAAGPMQNPLGFTILGLTVLAWLGIFFYLIFDATRRVYRRRRAKPVMQGKDPTDRKKHGQKQLHWEGRT